MPQLLPLLVAVILLVLVAAAPPVWAEAGGSRPLPNLVLPTLGGRQFWADRVVRDGWRIQRHVLTGHHRLLDAADRRRAWGAFAACRDELDRRGPPAATKAGPVVVLLHGLGRSRASLRRLHQALLAAGHEVLAIGYPSTWRDATAHAAQVAEVLDALPAGSRVAFVTHSLGGIVARHLLTGPAPAGRPWQATRVAMLFPPNQGSRLAEILCRCLPVRLLLGPVLDGLTPAGVRNLPAPPCPVLVIAGGRGDDRGRNPLLPGDDDGVVALAETRLPGARQLLLPLGHTFGMDDPRLIAAVRDFLRRPPSPD